MTGSSLHSTAAFCSPCRRSGLSATLPRLCRPDPALAEPLCPDPLRLSNRHHPGVAPAVAPHPDFHLVEPAAVAPVPLRVGGGVSNTLISRTSCSRISRTSCSMSAASMQEDMCFKSSARISASSSMSMSVRGP